MNTWFWAATLFLAPAACALSGTKNLNRYDRSPQYRHGRFHNPRPNDNPVEHNLWSVVEAWVANDAQVIPAQPLPVRTRTRADFEGARPRLAVTWLGHSTTLIEVDGHTLLTDPVWSERVSPFTMHGLSRRNGSSRRRRNVGCGWLFLARVTR